MIRQSTVVVEWDDHGDDYYKNGVDWAYHLRMGGIDAEDATDDPQPVDEDGDNVPEGYRHGIPHNMLGHALLPVPFFNALGEWVHDRTSPVVPTWAERFRQNWRAQDRWMAYRRLERDRRQKS